LKTKRKTTKKEKLFEKERERKKRPPNFSIFFTLDLTGISKNNHSGEHKTLTVKIGGIPKNFARRSLFPLHKGGYSMSKQIGEYQKNATSKVVANLQEYKGTEIIDIRTYYQDPISDEFKPTRKGISIPFDQIDSFYELIRKAREEAGKDVRVR